MKTITHWVFDQPQATARVAQLRRWVALTIVVLVALGPYDRFFVDLAPVIPAPSDTWLPRPGTAFPVLRWSTVVFALAMAWGRWPRTATLLVALSFGWLNATVTGFVPQMWSYNTHLLFITIALCLVGRGDDRQRPCAASFVLSFSILCIGLVYAQAALSKLIHAGPAWFVDGRTAWVFTVQHGTPLGQFLTAWPALFDGFHLLSGIVEAAFLPMVLVRRWQPIAATLAFSMHVGIGLVMGIWFWHLWVLFPPLFLLGTVYGQRTS